MFPFIIQSEIIANLVLDIVTPISGRTFGCRRNFHITTSLQNLCTALCQWVCMLEESATSDLRQLSFQSHYWSMSSKPLLRPPDHHVPPSTRPQTHPCTMRHGCGHNGQGSSRLSEEVHDYHTPCTTIGGTSFAPMPGYLVNPVPSWQKTSMLISFSSNECKTYLVYHVDNCLGVVSDEGVDHVALILTRGDCLHKGGEFMRRERASKQTYMGWPRCVKVEEENG